MKYFAIVFLIGFLWITRDIIRVPETFNDSFFKQFAGNQLIDPQVSWTNQYILGDLLSIVISLGSDLFHLLGSTILFLFFLIAIKLNKGKWTISFNSIETIIFSFIVFGAGNFMAWGLWRQLFNP